VAGEVPGLHSLGSRAQAEGLSHVAVVLAAAAVGSLWCSQFVSGQRRRQQQIRASSSSSRQQPQQQQLTASESRLPRLAYLVDQGKQAKAPLYASMVNFPEARWLGKYPGYTAWAAAHKHKA
jgi:hypothetical protein